MTDKNTYLSRDIYVITYGNGKEMHVPAISKEDARRLFSEGYPKESIRGIEKSVNNAVFSKVGVSRGRLIEIK